MNGLGQSTDELGTSPNEPPPFVAIGSTQGQQQIADGLGGPPVQPMDPALLMMAMGHGGYTMAGLHGVMGAPGAPIHGAAAGLVGPGVVHGAPPPDPQQQAQQLGAMGWVQGMQGVPQGYDALAHMYGGGYPNMGLYQQFQGGMAAGVFPQPSLAGPQGMMQQMTQPQQLQLQQLQQLQLLQQMQQQMYGIPMMQQHLSVHGAAAAPQMGLAMQGGPMVVSAMPPQYQVAVSAAHAAPPLGSRMTVGGPGPSMLPLEPRGARQHQQQQQQRMKEDDEYYPPSKRLRPGYGGEAVRGGGGGRRYADQDEGYGGGGRGAGGGGRHEYGSNASPSVARARQGSGYEDEPRDYPDASTAAPGGRRPEKQLKPRTNSDAQGPFLKVLDYKTFHLVLSLGVEIARALFPDPPMMDGKGSLPVLLVDKKGVEWAMVYHVIADKYSYVLRGGWPQFVAANRLSKGDVVVLAKDPRGPDEEGTCRVTVEVLPRKHAKSMVLAAIQKGRAEPQEDGEGSPAAAGGGAAAAAVAAAASARGAPAAEERSQDGTPPIPAQEGTAAAAAAAVGPGSDCLPRALDPFAAALASWPVTGGAAALLAAAALVEPLAAPPPSLSLAPPPAASLIPLPAAPEGPAPLASTPIPGSTAPLQDPNTAASTHEAPSPAAGPSGKSEPAAPEAPADASERQASPAAGASPRPPLFTPLEPPASGPAVPSDAGRDDAKSLAAPLEGADSMEKDVAEPQPRAQLDPLPPAATDAFLNGPGPSAPGAAPASPCSSSPASSQAQSPVAGPQPQ